MAQSQDQHERPARASRKRGAGGDPDVYGDEGGEGGRDEENERRRDEVSAASRPLRLSVSSSLRLFLLYHLYRLCRPRRRHLIVMVNNPSMSPSSASASRRSTFHATQWKREPSGRGDRG